MIHSFIWSTVLDWKPEITSLWVLLRIKEEQPILGIMLAGSMNAAMNG